MWLSFRATRNELKPHTNKDVGEEEDSCVSANINKYAYLK